MRIAIFTHNYPESKSDRQNAGIFVHDFARELTKQKNDVFVVCPGQKTTRLEIDNIPVYRFAWGRNKKLGQLKLWNPADLINLFQFLISGYQRAHKITSVIKPNLCLAMWAFPSGVFTYLLKKHLGIPYSIWVLGSDIYIYAKLPIVGYFIKKTLQEAEYLFADGIDLARKVESVSSKKCLFLPSASSFVSRKRKGESQNKKKIVLTFVGRMEPVKGPDIFINVLTKIKDKIKNFEIHLLGDGSLLPSLKNQVRDAGIENNIHFYGNVNDKQEIARVLSMSHWLIIPSRSDSIPLVFSEGMKNGAPVIASALPDLKYLINKYKVGIHFKPESENKLASIIANLPKLRRERTFFSQNTAKAAELFNIKKSAQEFLKVWKSKYKIS